MFRFLHGLFFYFVSFSSEKNQVRKLILDAHAKLLNSTESETYLDFVFEFPAFVKTFPESL